MVSLLGSVTSSLASGLFTSLGQLVLLVGGKVLLFLLLRHLHPAFEGIFGDARDLGPYLQIEVFDGILREGFKKSKWKFKMAFAMKGGGLECHLPILKNDFF